MVRFVDFRTELELLTQRVSQIADRIDSSIQEERVTLVALQAIYEFAQYRDRPIARDQNEGCEAIIDAISELDLRRLEANQKLAVVMIGISFKTQEWIKEKLKNIAYLLRYTNPT